MSSRTISMVIGGPGGDCVERRIGELFRKIQEAPVDPSGTSTSRIATSPTGARSNVKLPSAWIRDIQPWN